MSANHNDKELDQHIAALRDEPVPSGPTPELMAQTLKQINQLTARRSFTQRLVHMTLAQKIAAAVLFTLGALTLYFMFTLFSATSSVAFADVARKFNARTMTFNTTITLPGKAPITNRMLLSEPNRMRTEMMQGKMVTIQGDDAALILDVTNKTATRIEMRGVPQHDPSKGLIEGFRRLGEVKGKPAGEKTIDGVATVGFIAEVGNQQMTIWADKKNATPIRVEGKFAMGGEALVVMDHFEIDPPLDSTLFSLDVPEGYTLSTQTFDLPEPDKIDEVVADILKMYTNASGGKFPARLDDWNDFFKMTQKKGGKIDPKLIGKVGAVSGMLAPQKHGYLGKGVMLGDKDKIVYWRELDAKKGTVKVIYGDLTIKEVKATGVPTTQPAAQ